MDAKLLYWTWAFANFVAVAVCAGVGVRRIRARDLAGHRRMMLSSAALVGVFLVSYPIKLARLGGEDLSVWSTGARSALYFHETCILFMMLAGAYAGYRAFRFRAGLGGGPSLLPEPTPTAARLHHRWAGRVAVWSAVLALISSGAVLIGMYARA